MNGNDYTLGSLPDDGPVVGDVILPKWAKTAEDFVRINRLVCLRKKSETVYLTELILFRCRSLSHFAHIRVANSL